MRLLLPIILPLALTIPAKTSAQDASTIIQKSTEALNRDWKAAPEYNYFQRVRDGKGARTSEVIMISGSPYQRLTAVNNKPLTGEQEAAEQKKLNDAIAQRQRESSEESPAHRQI